MSITTTTATGAAPAPPRTRLTVPWPTVALLATAMAYADGYWMITVRGAVGAVQRAQGPFAAWWRESTLTLPFFALAVLVAMTVSARLFGPQLRRRRSVAGALTLVATAGTLAGIAEITASSAYDYHLQSTELRFMDSMHNVCVSTCLAQEQHATLAVHIQAVLFAARALLLTNIILVAWVFALLGGRLRIGLHKPGPAPRTGARGGAARRSANRIADIRLIVITGLLASATIHGAVAPEHLREWPVAGVFFLLLTTAQLAIAGSLVLTRNHGKRWNTILIQTAAALSAGTLSLWLYSRTLGLPIGPSVNTAEPVGIPDIMATILELVTMAAAATLLLSRSRIREQAPASDHFRAIGILAATAATITGLAFTPTGSTWLGDFGHSAQPMHHSSAH